MLITSEVVEPGFFGSMVLDAIQMFLSVVQRVLKAASTVIAVIPLSHVSQKSTIKPLQTVSERSVNSQHYHYSNLD